MKTIIKIMRSTLTSLLFLLLTASIIVEFVFIAVNKTGTRAKDIVDVEAITEKMIDKDISEDIKKILVGYVDDYLDYVFYKKGYPSLQTINLSNLDEDKKEEAKQYLNKLKNDIDLEYEMIVNIRDITNTITNKSIFLLVSIGVILAFLLLTISCMNFKKSTFLFGISIISSAGLTLILSVIVKKSIASLNENFLKILLQNTIVSSIIPNLLKVTIFSFIIGVLIVILFYVYKKILTKKKINNK